GFSAMWYFIGVATGYLIFIPFAVRLHRKHGGKYYTLADYFFDDWGKLTGRCAGTINVFIMLGWLLLNLIASSKVLSFFTGLSFEVATLIVAVFVLLYLLLGGFKAVVTTDVLQYGAIVIIFFVFTFVLLQGVTIPSADWNLWEAGAKNIISFFLLGILIPFSAPDLWQRVYAVKNLKVLRQSIFYSVIVYIAVAFLLALIGLAIKTTFPSVDPDIALIHGFVQLLPPGLLGLAVVIFFAAFMSSIDTYAYTAASSFVQDFFKGLSKKGTVRAIKWALLAVVALGSIVAVLLQDLIIGGFLFASYAMILAIPVLATWIKPTIHRTTLNVSLLLSLVVLTVLVIQGLVAGTIEPTILLKAIGLSLLGLVLGAIASKYKS
ncbi:MAG: sodium:solute symporter, partial [Candidatus Nanoarchaeia archaeon]